MENIRLILLLTGAAIVLGIFLLGWLPDKLKGFSLRQARRPSTRARATMSGEAEFTVDGMVDEELEKLNQLVGDDAAEPGLEIKAGKFRAGTTNTTSTDKVFSLSVHARNGVPFRGPILLGAVADAGLEFGDMQIFHRYESGTGPERLMFSLANVREPGVFDLSAMENFTTDGLVLFFQVPGQVDALKAFEAMVAAARALADSLDATIYDATHSVLTNQTISHIREEVIACQLQQRLAKRVS